MTIEVDLASRSIVQALGNCNRAPTKDGRRILQMWADREGLKLGNANTPRWLGVRATICRDGLTESQVAIELPDQGTFHVGLVRS